MYPPPAPPPYPRRRSIPVLVPHLVWEAILLLVTVAVAAVAAARNPLFGGDGVWWTMAYVGLVASGLALSLRTATPNLAVGGIAGAAGAGYAWLVVEAELAPLLAAAVVVIAAVVFGAVLGAVAGLTSAPAWAVSLAGLAATSAFAAAVLGPGGTAVAEQLPGPLDVAGVWFAAFLLISLAGGGVLAVPSVRRALSANRTGGDAVRLTGPRLVGALVGFVGSSALAGLAGLALVVQLGVVFGGVGDLFLLCLALGAALVGGVSVFGGRGGIAGTVLGVALLAIIVRWLDLEQGSVSWRWLVVVVAILAGVGLSRLIEAVAPVVPPAPAGPPLPPAPAVVPPPPAEPTMPVEPSDAGPAS